MTEIGKSKEDVLESIIPNERFDFVLKDISPYVTKELNEVNEKLRENLKICMNCLKRKFESMYEVKPI